MISRVAPALILAALKVVSSAPAITPRHDADQNWSNFYVLTELTDPNEYINKSRFHGKYVVPCMNGAVGDLFVQKAPGPVSFLNETFNYGKQTGSYYFSFAVDVKNGSLPMTQPMVQPFVPSNDSLFDPISVQSFPVANETGDLLIPTPTKGLPMNAQLFQNNDTGIVPINFHQDFLGWVVCEEQNYNLKLLWLHGAIVPIPANMTELPEECASINLRMQEPASA